MNAEVAEKLAAVKAIAARQYEYGAPALYEDDCAELEEALEDLEKSLAGAA